MANIYDIFIILSFINKIKNQVVVPIYDIICKKIAFYTSIFMIDNKEQQFLKLYDEFSDLVFRHCYFRVSDREKAKDLTQETFKKLWICMSEGITIRHNKAFIFKITNNLIIDSYRKKKDESLDKLQEEAGFDPANHDHENILNMISGHELIKLLDSLKSEYRDAIVMRYIDDLTPKEIAVITGESENVISVRIHRGLQKIKTIIQSHE